MTSNPSSDHPGSTENNGNHPPGMAPAWRFVLIALITIGICFRFANLDHKVYWFDEVSTSIRVAGQTKYEVEQQFVHQGTVSARSLMAYQTLQPNTPWQETFDALKQSPEQAPLYYLLARCWTQLFGSSVLAIRSLSAFISLLAFPCIYLLGLELFRNPRPGWILVMLFSVSPFFVAYAQEARPYSLWTTVTLLSCVTCLRAKRFNTTRSWGIFAIATTFSFYTSLLSLFVTIGQGLYLATQDKFRRIRTQYVAQYLAAVGIAIIFFSPWLVIILTSVKTFQDNTGWMRTPMELPARVAIWLASILLAFGDFPIPTSIDPVKTLGIVLLPLLLMVGGFLIIRPQHPKTQKQMGILMMSLPVVGASLLFGGLRVISSGSQVLALNPVVTLGLVVAPFIFALVIYALRFLQSSTSSRIWLFPLTLGLTTPLALMLIDLIQRGQSSANPRYMVPMQLAIQLAVAGMLSHKIFDHTPTSIGSSQRWAGVMALIIGVGLFSCTLNLEKSPIYQKSRNLHNHPIAEILNPIASPLILAEPQATLDLISLSHSLAPDTQVRPFIKDLSRPSLCQPQPLFIFSPTPGLQAQLQAAADYKASPIYQPQPLIPSEITLSLWSIQPVGSCRPAPIPQP